jgi:hypothetical protein
MLYHCLLEGDRFWVRQKYVMYRYSRGPMCTPFLAYSPSKALADPAALQEVTALIVTVMCVFV